MRHCPRRGMIEDGTYDKDGNSITRLGGYQIGIWSKIQVNNWAATNNPESKTIQWISKQMTRTTDEFGAWTDKNGDLYLEPCIWIQDLKTALVVGRALKQIAIWDWANMREVAIKNKE